MKPYTPHEFKVMLVRECEPMSQILDQPELVAQYWRDNIPKADWFDPTKEALVVLVLNTRKRIIGHNLVSLGGLDYCQVTPLHVFRPVIAVAGSSIVLAHNLCVAAHKLCYVTRRVMCSCRLSGLTLTRESRRRECYAR